MFFNFYLPFLWCELREFFFTQEDTKSFSHFERN